MAEVRMEMDQEGLEKIFDLPFREVTMAEFVMALKSIDVGNDEVALFEELFRKLDVLTENVKDVADELNQIRHRLPKNSGDQNVAVSLFR